MSVWSRLRARFRRQEVVAPAPGAKPVLETAVVAAEPEPDVAVLIRLVSTQPPELEQALAAFRRLRGHADERGALDAIAVAHARHRAPSELVVAAAELLVERGQQEDALRLLDDVQAPEALLLQADLCALRGEVARALLLSERALARDIDAPGARERHARWTAELGGSPAADRLRDEPTLLASELPTARFRIVGEAGRGGAASVYEAIDEPLGRTVALKIYHEPGAARAQLEREARIAVALSGRGIVRVFDADPRAGWIALEWLAGGALRRWIGSASIDLLWPVERWVVPLLVAVARVHAHGLVHADLKPANVLFRASDEPIVSDFGLARATGERSEAGSLGYLSPERLAGEALSPRDDVYACGRILQDALDVLERAGAGSPKRLEAWRLLVAAALVHGERRPADAAALSALLPLG
jgi:serine/threonine-protein kinase